VAPLDSPQGLLNGFVLAMTYEQQGRADEARAVYARTVAQERRFFDSIPKGTGRAVPNGWRWRDWLFVQLLRSEAAELLGVVAPPPRPKE
jgi:hypothetical protein